MDDPRTTDTSCLASDVGPPAVEDACTSCDGAVATTMSQEMSSDVGPPAVVGGREQLDIRIKLLTEKLRQEREEALERNKGKKYFKVSLRHCLKQKAGVETIVQAKQKRKPAGAETVIEGQQKRRRVAGAESVVQRQQKCKKRKCVAHAETIVQEQQKRKMRRNKKRSTVVLPDSALKMRRLKATLKKRKQRQKIKENPEALKLQRAQEKARRDRRKMNGSIKPIAELSDREQRRLRKQWRKNTERYRQKKKVLDDAQQVTVAETLPSEKQRLGRRKIRRQNAAVYRRLEKAERMYRRQVTLTAKYRKQCQRNREKRESVPSPFQTPRTRVRLTLKKSHTEVRKRLLFGEVLVSQLRHSLSRCKSNRDKQLFSRVMAGNLLKKYKLLKLSSSLISSHSNRRHMNISSLNYRRRKKCNALRDEVKTAVQSFFEEDANSSLAPGKNDTITYRKDKKQKRYLVSSIEKLHKKFLQSHNFRVSYSSFCRLKPFWVVQPKVTARNTCMCIKHANFQFLIDKLHQQKVIAQKQAADLCKVVCCDPARKECMFKECSRCQVHRISDDLELELLNEETFYYQWVSVKENRTDKNKNPISVKVTKKVSTVCTVKELISTANSLLGDFLRHEYIAHHQFRHITEVKRTLRCNEAVILIDFSENYECKLSAEVQSAHFGASKKQISLHTGVVYTRNPDAEPNMTCATLQPICTSFCTVSDSYRHDASAIWAHLQPVLKLTAERFPDIDTIHFQSDGPTTQYRNKTNFYLLTHFMNSFAMKEVTWNFSESGHGKSSADGIGGSVKRTADNGVAHGADIANAESFLKTVGSASPKVNFFEVLPSNIEVVDAVLPSKIKPVPNTMQIHQLTWSKLQPSSIGMRYLSCCACSTSSCSHYALKPSAWHFSETTCISTSVKGILSLARLFGHKTAVRLADCAQTVNGNRLSMLFLLHLLAPCLRTKYD